ncbi:uncharacterized protein LOC123672851 isoform X2 [Harmonia axyridis]|uniref:uncharacterized protein LOC123672851 isoform X2 n=1 Tax=Harmonia axyridis TaxID=115357 RepID=UPI001E277580|nr:uncharacterized protein LOC123672851 isoform X2 [Harmonia axyridis]
MNRKLLSVFFSALVCSTLGHEHLRAHELQRNNHAQARSIGSHHVRNHQQQCSYICPVPSPSPEINPSDSSISLVFIEETKVFAVVNTTEEVAIVFQIGEPIGLIVNGKTGVSIVVNIDKKTVVYYPSGCNDNLWKESKSSLVDYLKNLGPLTNVNNWKNGQSFKLNTVTKEVKTLLVSIVQFLDVALAIRVKTNPDAVINYLGAIIHTLLESSDVLELLLVRLKSTVNVILGGLSKVVNIAIGLKTIGLKLQGGIKSLLDLDINVSLLLGQNSGLNSLLDLLIQVGVRLDLTKVLGNLLQSPESILGLAVTLDGGIYVGISGITAVIYNIQLYAAKKISLEALIDVLIQVESDHHVKITREVLNNVLTRYFVLAKSQAAQYNTGSSWSTLNKFFQDIKDDKLVINGINVSTVINILISTSGSSSLGNIVKILTQLKSIVSLSKIVATLYFRLIYFVISGEGLVFIHQLLPDIKIAINLSSTTSILTQILSNVNVLQIVSYLLRLDIIGAITHLPVLGPILQALDSILTAVGLALEVTVTSALKAVGSILDDLKDIILFGLGRGGKAPADTGIAGLSLLGGGISVSITTSWSSTDKSSSSGSSSSKGTSVSPSSSGSSSPKGTSVLPSSSGSSSSKGSSSTAGITIGGGSSSSSGGSVGGSGSHSGGQSIGGGAASAGGSSAGGSGSNSGGQSIGGGAASAGGSSAGGSGSHSGGISAGGSAGSSGGSSAGGSGSHSGGISVGGSAASAGGNSVGGSASHSGGISAGGHSHSSGGQKGDGWSLGNIFGGDKATHGWSLF